MQIKKYERKDSEIHYLRETFHDFFRYSNTTHINYKWEDFEKFIEFNHRRIPFLIKVT